MTWAKPSFMTLKSGESARFRLLPAPQPVPQPHWAPNGRDEAARWRLWWQRRANLNDPVRQQGEQDA